MSPDSDRSHVGQVVDHDGFEEEFDDLFRTAFIVTRRLLGNVTQAEDAAAEALARTLLAWRRVARHPNKQAFVSKVAANVAIDQLRRTRVLPEPALSGPDGSEQVAQRLDLVAALKKLSRRQRQVIALRYLADLDEAAVADSLGISVNSVKKHAQRGMSALRGRTDAAWLEVSLVSE